MKAVGGFNRRLNPTTSSKEDKNPASFYENYSIFHTLIRCDFTFKLFNASF